MPAPVILCRRIPDAQTRTRLINAAPRAEWHFRDEAADIADIIDKIVIVAGNLRPVELAKAYSLRWLHSWAAGPEITISVRDHACVVTSSKGNGAMPLAEHALMLMLMLNRDAQHWIDAQKRRTWSPIVHDELAGKTAALIGLGNAGRHLAGVLDALAMTVIGCRRNPELGLGGVQRLYPPTQLLEMLAVADFVVVTAPLTPRTRNLLGHAEFRAMKPTTFYICVSRGGIANEHILCRALREGWIAGAGLDAHTQEPLPSTSPLWGDCPEPSSHLTMAQQPKERHVEALTSSSTTWNGSRMACLCAIKLTRRRATRAPNIENHRPPGPEFPERPGIRARRTLPAYRTAYRTDRTPSAFARSISESPPQTPYGSGSCSA